MFEWGTLYKRTLGEFRGAYNIHYVRDGMKGPVTAKRVLRLDRPDSADNPLTANPADQAAYCGFVGIRAG
jgi:hypothetical protein